MDNAGGSEKDQMNLCKLCNVRPTIYTCPRCGIKYCNIDCYKSEAHVDCSESFYKQCVEEELQSQENDPETKQRMIEILKRLHEEDLTDDVLEADEAIDEEQVDLDSDDENVPDLEDRLQNVNLDNADELWSVLTNSERQEFEALVKNGEAEKLLPQWVPWWTHCIKKKLIEEIGTESIDNSKKCPSVIDVPIFNEVQKASPNVYFNIANIIYAYAYLALYYNGDYLNCPEEATIVFLNICDNLKNNKVYEHADSAIESVVQNVINCSSLPQDEQTFLTFKEAGMAIMQGPEERNKYFYVSVALSELYRLVTAENLIH